MGVEFLSVSRLFRARSHHKVRNSSNRKSNTIDAIMQEGSMGKRKQLSTAGLFLLFLSACTGGELTMGLPTNSNVSVGPSNTSFPSWYPMETIAPNTPTPTPYSTIIPVDTPTEGPPPDLEVFNLTLYSHERNGGVMIGELRNNTDAAMVFPIDISKKRNPILRFSAESWYWDVSEGDHYSYEFSVGRGRVEFPNTNCFLYPGETGVIIIDSVGNCQNFPENCIYNAEDIFENPEGIGMRLIGYEDLKTYVPWPNLNPDYHPQAENLEYTITNEKIELSFDLPKTFFKGYSFNYTAWVLLYDKNGGLISILFHTDIEKIFVETNGSYHISGESSNSGPMNPDYFHNSNASLLHGGWDFSKVDHARVFVEEQHEFLCGTYTDYDIYRERME
jgi:hypothetical protein